VPPGMMYVGTNSTSPGIRSHRHRLVKSEGTRLLNHGVITIKSRKIINPSSVEGDRVRSSHPVDVLVNAHLAINMK